MDCESKFFGKRDSIKGAQTAEESGKFSVFSSQALVEAGAFRRGRESFAADFGKISRETRAGGFQPGGLLLAARGARLEGASEAIAGNAERGDGRKSDDPAVVPTVLRRAGRGSMSRGLVGDPPDMLISDEVHIAGIIFNHENVFSKQHMVWRGNRISHIFGDVHAERLKWHRMKQLLDLLSHADNVTEGGSPGKRRRNFSRGGRIEVGRHGVRKSKGHGRR